jgi:hypothetical protein
MKKLTLLLTICLVAGCVLPLLAQPGNFGTSLHKTREGKPTWYNSENGGYETLTGVPIEDLGCVSCHPGDGLDANGDPVVDPFVANCVDCHATNSGTPGPVTEADCLGCHGRQAKLRALGWSDVHRDASTPLVCWDCHGTTDMHGDGTPYTSMLEPGAVVTDCEQAGCHESLPPTHAGNDPHGGALHCSSCHMQTNLSCYNCHFDSQIEAHVKRAKQPITGFVILMNRAKDGKVHPATFQSLYHDTSGGSWIAMAPNYTHSATKTLARTCADCHQNLGGSIPAIEEYNAGNGIKFATWNSGDSTLSWKQGIVPLPVDYRESFKIDFITYEGNLSDPAGASKNWTYAKSAADGFQLLYGAPLSTTQMDALGMDTTRVIPVELSSFSAVVDGDAVTLHWSTASETNNQGFELHRAMGENKYEKVGFVKGNGTTTEAKSYTFTDSQLAPGFYAYRLKQIDFDGTFEYSYEIMVEVINPIQFALEQNYPNPFNPSTTIKFSIPEKSAVELNVYNQLGELVQTLVNKEMTAGTYDVEFNGENLSSGIYFYQIKAKNFVSTRKLVLLK